MKKGHWNYTEDIEYTVLWVRIHKDSEMPLSWQNAFDGQCRQVVKIVPKSGNEFFIDNEDGSGLIKIQSGGGPDMFSRHLKLGTFEIYQEMMEHEWNSFSSKKHLEIERMVDEYNQTNHPEEFEWLQRLKTAFDPSKFFK